jgi:hypothetical protein
MQVSVSENAALATQDAMHATHAQLHAAFTHMHSITIWLNKTHDTSVKVHAHMRNAQCMSRREQRKVCCTDAQLHAGAALLTKPPALLQHATLLCTAAPASMQPAAGLPAFCQ